MKINKPTYLIVILIILFSSFTYSQERRRIQIDTSGFITKNEADYPGATILTRDDMNQVKISLGKYESEFEKAKKELQKLMKNWLVYLLNLVKTN